MSAGRSGQGCKDFVTFHYVLQLNFLDYELLWKSYKNLPTPGLEMRLSTGSVPSTRI